MCLRRFREQLRAAVTASTGGGAGDWHLACAAIAFAAASNMLATKAWSQAHTLGQSGAGGSDVSDRRLGWLAVLSRAPRRYAYAERHHRFPRQCQRRDQDRRGRARRLPAASSISTCKSLRDGRADSLHVHGLVTYGPPFSANYLGNILAVSNIEAGPMARLYAFWYEQNASNDLWSVRVGLMLADSQFLQSKTAANFINNGISWPDFLSANLPASGPAFPLPAPGIRVRVKPRDDMQFQAAVFSGDPERRRRLKSTGAASDRDGVQLQRRRFFHRRGELSCPIRARTPAGFPAPTASAPGITPARVSPISASTITASRWQTRNRPAFRWSMPAMAASMA